MRFSDGAEAEEAVDVCFHAGRLFEGRSVTVLGACFLVGCPLGFGKGSGWFGLGVGRDGGFCRGLGRLGGAGCAEAVEVGGGCLEGVDEQAGAFEVDAVAGEAGSDVGEGLLDGQGAGEIADVEGLVLDDGRDGIAAVGEAHVVVVHGAGAAAPA